MPLLSPRSRVGDYELVRHVATGAMSEVYEGRHLASGLRVAVKVLSPELCEHEELVARFRNEGHTLLSLSHAHLVRVFACGDLPEGVPYTVLEWLPVDLHQAISHAAEPLPPQTAMQVAGQLAEALDALHTHGIIHRDLKPSNVLLSPESGCGWDVKLADLGLAKARPETQAPSAKPVSTGSGTLIGTWDYMAPEQWIHSKGVDAQVDVYALGVLLFQMLTGRLPFIAAQQKDLMFFHLFEQPPLDQLEGRVPASTRELIARMLDKNPSRRPTMREVSQSTPPTHS
ncbi:MAG TPA: serine/threonine-protein kinase [Archangium sp.]|uniref:serine/threonine-protein kinase n=1 Tax=Archangium sp. TaxID=1872627 RepID=UPI002ED8F1B7